jgi:hypothetical protein
MYARRPYSRCSPGAAGRILPKGQTAGKRRQDHLTCTKTLYATIATSVATNKPMPKKRIFITIGTGLAYEAFFKEKEDTDRRRSVRMRIESGP